ncbi:MAG: c-type cytochrome [Candidatus Methylomirabilales bacterium]
MEKQQGRVDVRRMTILTVMALAVSTFIAVGPLSAEVQGDAKAGKEKYLTLCASCHGTSGKGDGPAAAALNPKPRDHTNGKYMNTLTDQYLFSVIKEGGKAVGLSELMPPWGRALNDKEIRDLVAYVRTLAVPPYKPPRK